MITRIVKMTFRESECDAFLNIFEEFKSAIRHAPGCSHLRLYRDESAHHIFFTYSHWDHEQSLDAYRNSPTFEMVWPRTKALFAAPAEAWTLKIQSEPN